MERHLFIEETLRNVQSTIMDAFPPTHVTQKEPHEVVTEVDVSTEKTIRKDIKSAFPTHGIVGEELPTVNPDAEYQWVIDPIDGTTNYSHGIPFFCTAIALLHNNKVQCAGVLSPIHDTVWLAKRLQGAWKNGEEILRREPKELRKEVFGFCHSAKPQAVTYIQQRYAKMKASLLDVRQFGAANLEICLAADGNLGGFIGKNIKPWDFLPGCLIAQEAGLAVQGLQDKHWETPDQDDVLVCASNHRDTLKTVLDI